MAPAPANIPATDPLRCTHCGSPVPEGARNASFCCAGCEAVHALLVSEGLTRFYALSRSRGAPVAERKERSLAWLEPLLLQAAGGPGNFCALELDVQGVHCAGCVWLMEELGRRTGSGSVTVNPALGKVALRWKKGGFDVSRFVRDVESFGYQFGPARKRPAEASFDLPIRLGVCAAITMNVMIFSVSFYLGLTSAEETVFHLFTDLSIALSTVTVLVGGWPFFRSALQGLKRGVLHLDLPIALGICGVYATSLLEAAHGHGDLAYFDTLNTFVTLMLVGRWLQHRVLERNRRFLLEDDGAAGLFVRRERGATLETVRAPELRQGDCLLLAPGDVVPVDARLLDARGRFATDWITGEPEPIDFLQGATLPAGACNASDRAVRAEALTGFDRSPLGRLLRQLPPSRPGSRALRFWDVLARGWAAGVIALAALGVLLWWHQGPARALEVASALLVVTCPCALGITVPLAYELAQTELARRGLFVRSPDLLDRLLRVKQVLFDKTGTLTLGRLELAAPHALVVLPEEARNAAFDLASRSNHPASRCLAAALARHGARFDPAAEVREEPGKGMELVRGGHTWRLGARSWAAPESVSPHEGPVLSCDGESLATFPLREAVRPDARIEVERLQQQGLSLHLLSGDAPARALATAKALGIPEAHARGGLSPEAKAEAVAALDREDTLYLGDGVNDSLAFERAFCAGTPAIDRPALAAKSDFFLLGEGLASLRESLAVAQRLRRGVRAVLAVALAYNVLVVASSLAGHMSPLRAAIAMPLSSLVLTALTLFALSPARTRNPAPVLREARA